MKKLFLLFVTVPLFWIATPSKLQAQCPANADSNPCFSLPSGPCVTFPGGKLRFWLASQVIGKAKTYMDQELDFSYWEYVQKYYSTEELTIEYLGGTWSGGQTFRVQIGDCIAVILMDEI